MADVIRQGLPGRGRAVPHLLAKNQGKPGFPRTVENGALVTVGPKDWTAGFFPGSLWYLFEATGDQSWKAPPSAARGDRAGQVRQDPARPRLHAGSGYGNGYA
jgi:unsaturated chondroitin disaccharide hydrolase